MLKLKLEESRGYERNVYYRPEAHGLTKVDEVDYSDGCYQFDLRVVWRDAEGRLWTARDSACSCLSPFEDTEELDRLLSFAELEREYENETYRKPDEQAWRSFRDAVKAAFA